jgi:hypothetical protein
MSIDATPSPMQENADGAILWLHDAPLAIALTATEARTLADWLSTPPPPRDR